MNLALNRRSRLIWLAITGVVCLNLAAPFASSIVRLSDEAIGGFDQSSPKAAQVEIAHKTKKEVRIVFESASGKLRAGTNELCVFFRRPDEPTPVDVQDLTVDFRPLVGKIREEPIRAKVIRQGIGRYCGTVDLGHLYHEPSNYHVLVHYVDADGRRKKLTLYLSAK